MMLSIVKRIDNNAILSCCDGDAQLWIGTIFHSLIERPTAFPRMQKVLRDLENRFLEVIVLGSI